MLNVTSKLEYKPDFILVDRSVKDLPSTKNILSKFQGIDPTVIEDVRAIKRPADFTAAKKTILLTANRGDAFKPCQGIGGGHLCCNYWVLDLISNCPLDCSYCILQSYLENNPILTIYTNIDEIISKASDYFEKNKTRRFRVGSGELSDSLALDHITGFSEKLINAFNRFENVTLELKTKTDNVFHLPNLYDLDSRLPSKGGHVVISWSVNPQNIIGREEAGAAPLSERFNAAAIAIKSGYKIGFHFDPIIYSDNWEAGYKQVAKEIVEHFPHNKIAWISLGTLRFPHNMKEITMKRFPRSRIFYNELVPVNGKVRYFRPIRENIYKKMLTWFSPLKDTTPIYLCMETKQVWKNIMPDIGKSNHTIEKCVCRY